MCMGGGYKLKAGVDLEPKIRGLKEVMKVSFTRLRHNTSQLERWLSS